MNRKDRSQYQTGKRLVLLFLAMLIASVGCNRQPTQPPITGVTYDQLYRLQNAYLEFCDQRNKPPKSLQDLQKVLAKSGQASTVIEAVEKDPELELFWGFQPDMKSSQPVVLGYKPSATDDQYIVMTQQGIVTMDDTSLQSASFPPGRSAPTLNPINSSN